MSTRSERDRQKALQEKHQMILSQLLKDEDNKYCVDCDAKGPRWASWNLGIFLCIRCAGIHRNLGVHISKVKSVNLDTWTPEQIAMMQEMGNSRARAVYEANVPDSYRRPQTDSALEAFIRSKYEQKKYIAHEWVPPQPKIQSCDNTVTRHKKTPKYQDPIFEEMPKKDKKKSRSKTDSTLKLNAPPEKVASKSTPHTETYKKHYSEADIKPPVKSAPVDLLGLDDPAPSIVPSSNDINDPFGAFIGCPTTNVTSTPSQQPVTSQPDLVSTVNQNGDLSQLSNSNNVAANPGTSTENGDISLIGDSSSGGAAEKKSKESILALYGSGGGGNTQQQMYSVPGGMYMQGQQMPAMSQQAQMYPGGQMSNGMVSGIQPGLMTQPQNNMMQQQGVPMWNTNMAMPVNNMQGQNAGMAGMNPGMVNNMMMGGQPMYNNTGNMYNMQNQQMHQLQNQMGSMNMGQQSMGGYQQPSAVGVGTGMAGNWGMQQTGNTLSTNLWQ